MILTEIDLKRQDVFLQHDFTFEIRKIKTHNIMS